MVALIALLAVLGPAGRALRATTRFSVRERLLPPSAAHPFGTDEFGRDVLSRVLAGAHHSLAMGFGATAISLALGVPLGLLAAFHRGWVEEAIMRGVDLLISVPPMLLGLLLLAVTEPGLGKTILAVGMVYVPIMIAPLALGRARPAGGGLRRGGAGARRGRMAHPRARDPAQRLAADHRRDGAARDLRHPARLRALAFSVSAPQPPASEWGLMIAESRPFIEQAPWIGLAPGLVPLRAAGGDQRRGRGAAGPAGPAAPGTRAWLRRPRRRCWSCDDLSLGYRTARGPLRGVGRRLPRRPARRAMGLVGESGSGKSVARAGGARAARRRKRRRSSPARGVRRARPVRAAAASLRGRPIGTVFQDPVRRRSTRRFRWACRWPNR